MKRRLVAAAVCVGALGAAPTAMAQDETFVCNGEFTGIAAQNVVVPEDGNCRLRDSDVAGNIVVRAGGGLILEGTRVGGNVRGSEAAYWGFTDDRDDDSIVTTVRGNVEFVETTANPLLGSEGNSNSPYNFACDRTAFGGNFSIRNSEPDADFLFGAAFTDNPAESILTPRTVTLPPAEPFECDDSEDDGGNTVGGNYETVDNTSEVRQRYNRVDQMWTFVNNVGDGEHDVINNDVGRRMTCRGNDPEPNRRGNTEGEEAATPDQCDP